MFDLMALQNTTDDAFTYARFCAICTMHIGEVCNISGAPLMRWRVHTARVCMGA
jgi:hypothetical protein